MGIFYEPWGYVSSISANNWAYHWDGEFVNIGMSFEELGLKHQKIQIYITMTFLGFEASRRGMESMKQIEPWRSRDFIGFYQGEGSPSRMATIK